MRVKKNMETSIIHMVKGPTQSDDDNLLNLSNKPLKMEI